MLTRLRDATYRGREKKRNTQTEQKEKHADRVERVTHRQNKTEEFRDKKDSGMMQKTRIHFFYKSKYCKGAKTAMKR